MIWKQVKVSVLRKELVSLRWLLLPGEEERSKRGEEQKSDLSIVLLISSPYTINPGHDSFPSFLHSIFSSCRPSLKPPSNLFVEAQDTDSKGNERAMIFTFSWREGEWCCRESIITFSPLLFLQFLIFFSFTLIKWSTSSWFGHHHNHIHFPLPTLFIHSYFPLSSSVSDPSSHHHHNHNHFLRCHETFLHLLYFHNDVCAKRKGSASFCSQMLPFFFFFIFLLDLIFHWFSLLHPASDPLLAQKRTKR